MVSGHMYKWLHSGSRECSGGGRRECSVTLSRWLGLVVVLGRLHGVADMSKIGRNRRRDLLREAKRLEGTVWTEVQTEAWIGSRAGLSILCVRECRDKRTGK